jgi:hypothetical protein
MTEVKAKYVAGEPVDQTEYTPATLRAAFSDPTRYVLPPGSMTLEPEQKVAGKFADAWARAQLKSKLIGDGLCLTHGVYSVDEDNPDGDCKVCIAQAEVAELRGRIEATVELILSEDDPDAPGKPWLVGHVLRRLAPMLDGDTALPPAEIAATSKHLTWTTPWVMGACALFDARLAPFWTKRSINEWLWFDDVAEGWRAYDLIALKVARNNAGDAQAVEFYVGPLCLSVFFLSQSPAKEGGMT